MRILTVLILVVLVYPKIKAQEAAFLEKIQIDQNNEALTEFTILPSSNISLPLSVENISVEEHHLEKLSDLTHANSSITDSYNASGYYDHLKIRGYTLDNRFNYYREGLLISAESPISFHNKESVDIIKGVSGLQIGSASPGGAVNYQVKRPKPDKKIQLKAHATDAQALSLVGDINQPLNEKSKIRWVFAVDKLHQHIENSDGNAFMVAFAHDYLLSERTLLQTEFEWNYQSQHSQATTSLWGNRIPTLENPDLNLNKQSWSKPVVFQGLTASTRLAVDLESWETSATTGFQILKTDDRLNYPYGCSSEGFYDRFCSDGSYDLYDYRSENEWRKSYGVKLLAQKKFRFKNIHQGISFGTQHFFRSENYEAQAYNLVGQGNADGTAALPENPAKLDPNTNREAQSHDLHFSYILGIQNLEVSTGLRLTHLERKSIRTDDSRPTDFSQNFLLPWLGLSYNVSSINIFTSYAEGIESYVVPNKSSYLNAGDFIPNARTIQYEAGLRSIEPLWSATIFKINRPSIADTGSIFEKDGVQEHIGSEFSFEKSFGKARIESSLTLLVAEEKNHHIISSLNGHRPVNVPDQSLRLGASYLLSSPFSAKLYLQSVYEGRRAITSDNSLILPAWTRFDLRAQWSSTIETKKVNWELEIYNLLDHHYWKESPTQYGHIYLYPELRRFFKLSINISI